MLNNYCNINYCHLYIFYTYLLSYNDEKRRGYKCVLQVYDDLTHKYKNVAEYFNFNRHILLQSLTMCVQRHAIMHLYETINI